MTLNERLYRFRSFWIFPLSAIALLFVSFRAEPQSRLGDLLWLFPIGLVMWTLLEYGLHRFVFHIQIPVPNPRLREILNSSHLGHHASPRDPEKILARSTYAMVISSLLFGLLYLTSGSFFASSGVMAGIWTGFLYYEAVHYRVHLSLAPSGFIGRQRRTHFFHHFTNNKRCFGVTTPLWDYVFGTAVTESGQPKH